MDITVIVTFSYAYKTYIVSPLALQAWSGAYRGGRPPTACYIPVLAFDRSSVSRIILKLIGEF